MHAFALLCFFLVPILRIFARPSEHYDVHGAQKNLAATYEDNGRGSGMVPLYESLTHPEFQEYRIRVKTSKLCDLEVKHYAGYLDITNDKHLFFWFFEARNSPETAPLILWLAGGPGCSSAMGLFLEHGPCRIAEEGNNVTYNPYSWNTNANIIYLDQPISTGFSYSDTNTTVNTTHLASIDVYAFLQLFLTHFKQYAPLSFHIAGESFGGRYAPIFASEIHKRNKGLEVGHEMRGLVKINLESVVLANGHTNPVIQFPSMVAYACEGPYAFYEDSEGPECKTLRSKIPECDRLTKSCYETGSKVTCVEATNYCSMQFMTPVQERSLNPYDIRRTCDQEKNGDLCYEEFGWLDRWMNLNSTKEALGVDPSKMFTICNPRVHQAFVNEGELILDSSHYLVDLVNDGIRLLMYAGTADFICNFMGNEAWLLKLDNKFKDELSKSDLLPWITTNGQIAGKFRSVGDGAGNVTFVAVYGAGHLIPFDQPSHALDLITKWLRNIPITSYET